MKKGSSHLFFAAALHHQLEPALQNIEVWSTTAIPTFRVVGLPGPEIIESVERVRAAVDTSGSEFPRKRVLVNLSPAGIRKQGTGTDLAIALAVLLSDLAESEAPATGDAKRRLVVASGELGLDGLIASAGKITRTCLAAVRAGATDLLLSRDDESQAVAALELIFKTTGQTVSRLWFASSLREALELLQLPTESCPPLRFCDHHRPEPRRKFPELLVPSPQLLRRLMVCSAGAHSLLLLGPKGTGKTASLQWLRALREDLSPQDLLDQRLMQELIPYSTPSPTRSPVCEVSQHARAEVLLGSIQRGQIIPGQLALAHGGILIADEFLEWRRDAREALRDPLESGRLTLQRAHQSVVFPARFIFAGTANLCPCGGVPPEHGLESRRAQTQGCRCSPRQRQEYLERLSGPILDRMDCIEWVVQMPLHSNDQPGTFDQSLETVERTRERLRRRWGELPGRLPGAELEAIIRSHPELSELQAKWGSADASLRRRHREIRVALTLAALASPVTSDSPSTELLPSERHFIEARPSALQAIRALQSGASRTPMRFEVCRTGHQTPSN